MMSYFSLTILLVCGFATGANISPYSWPCPEAERFSPCICTANNAEYFLDADCSAAKTDSDLLKAFSFQFPFPTFRKLIIDHENCDDCSLYELDPDMFDGVSFTSISITHTSLEIVDDGAFSSSHKTLVDWHMDNNKLKSFPFESIASYENLTSLTLNRNDFPSDYVISDIQSSSLRTLNLARNDYLNFLPSLVELCPSLTYLRLNNIEENSLPEYPESPISMFRSLQHMSRIYLNDNNIQVLHSNVIQPAANSLTEVDLSNNNINDSVVYHDFVSGFDHSVPNVLNLANNKINRLDEERFRGVFLGMVGTGVIDLSSNPLLCGCDIDWLVLNRTMINLLTTTSMCSAGIGIHEVSQEVICAQCGVGCTTGKTTS